MISDEQANEVIRLRHHLRRMAAMRSPSAAAFQALARFKDLSEELGDPDLVFEAARWRAQLEHIEAVASC